MTDDIRFVRLLSETADELDDHGVDSFANGMAFSPSCKDHSWSFLDDRPTGVRRPLKSSVVMDARGPQAPRTSTADIAHFLKHTGPPTQGHSMSFDSVGHGSRKRRNGIALFKRHKALLGRCRER